MSTYLQIDGKVGTCSPFRTMAWESSPGLTIKSSDSSNASTPAPNFPAVASALRSASELSNSTAVESGLTGPLLDKDRPSASGFPLTPNPNEETGGEAAKAAPLKVW